MNELGWHIDRNLFGDVSYTINWFNLLKWSVIFISQDPTSEL